MAQFDDAKVNKLLTVKEIEAISKKFAEGCCKILHENIVFDNEPHGVLHCDLKDGKFKNGRRV